MMYRIKDHGMVDPFEADNEEIAMRTALHLLGFDYGVDDLICQQGLSATAKQLDVELEIV